MHARKASGTAPNGILADAKGIPPPQVSVHIDDAFGRLLLRWQDEQDETSLQQLITTAQGLVESIAEQSLQASGFESSQLIDDTVSLTFNHIRRLPFNHRAVANTPGGERAVRPFQAILQKPNAGSRYLVWLTQRRAMDIARRARRDQRGCRCYTASNPHQVAAAIMQASCDQQAAAGLQAVKEDRLEWIQTMFALLDQADRLLMEMVLEGKTLATIAHMLDCSEGTVSRRRQRIEQSLREAAHTHTHTRRSIVRSPWIACPAAQ